MATMKRSVRGFEPVYDKVTGGSRFLLPDLYSVIATTNRNQAIVPGMLVVVNSSGGVDGARAVDTTYGGSGQRKIMGLVEGCYDSKGCPLDRQYLGTADAGFVRLYKVRDLVIRGVEDGTGGVLATTAYSCAHAPGTVSPTATTTETNYPDPRAADVLDSSVTTSSSSNAHGLLLDKREPTASNDNSSAYVWLFTVNPDYLAATA